MQRAIGFFGIVGLLNLGAAAGPLPGQQMELTFQRWEPATSEFVHTSGRRWQDTMPLPRRDYRYEGLAVGGVVLGAAGAWIGANLAQACPTVPGARCESDRLGNAIATGLAGAALGGGLGYLVGRISPKPYSNQLLATNPPGIALIPDSTRRRVGYQHWKGAAIGAGSAVVIGTLLMLAADGSCSDCNSNTTAGDYVKAGGVVAAIGGALGFLAGLATPKYE